MKKNLSMVLVIFSLVSGLYAQISTAQSGGWSETTTWDGGVLPTGSDDVEITAGHTVMVDVADAECKTITFGDATAQVNMSTGNSVLSVYGDFTPNSTGHIPFSNWEDGAVLRFTGSAETQTINNIRNNNSTTEMSFFRILEIDKTAGIVTYAGSSDSKLNVSDAIIIKNGTFQIPVAFDINGRSFNGIDYAYPEIVVESGGTFEMLGGASQIVARFGTSMQSIGKMTVWGTAIMASTSSNRIRIDDIDVKDGGILSIPYYSDGGNMGTGLFDAGTITVKNGGSITNSLNTDIWYENTRVNIDDGGIYEVTSSSPAMPVFSKNQGTVLYSRNVSGSDQIVVDMDYHNIEFRRSNSGAKKIWTLAADRVVSGDFINGYSAESVINADSPFKITVHGTFRITSGSVDNSDPDATIELADGAEISRATGTLANALFSAGLVNVRYWSTSSDVITGPELPESVNDLTIIVGEQTVTLNQDLEITGNLTLSSGVLDNSSYSISMTEGSAIRRATGELTAEPVYGGFIDIEYISTVGHVETGFEIPEGYMVNNLILSGSMGVTLTQNVMIYNQAFMDESSLITGNYSLILTHNATLAESNGNQVWGTVEATRNLQQNVNEDFGNLGLDILALGSSPGYRSIIRHTGEELSLGKNGVSILRSFEAGPVPVKNSFDATLVFSYTQEELNGLEERELTLYALSENEQTWLAFPSVRDIIQNTITATGINELTIFTLGNPPNNTPVISGVEDVETDEDNPISLKIYASDPDTDLVELFFESDTTAIILSYSETDSMLTMTPEENWNGVAQITVLVTDGLDTVSVFFTLTVHPVNDPPEEFALSTPVNGSTIVVYPDSLNQNILFTWTIPQDPDGDVLISHFVPGGDWEGLETEPVTENQIRIYVSDFVEFLSGESIQCTWTIYITDGIDTVYAENGPFSLTLQTIPNTPPVLPAFCPMSIYEDTDTSFVVFATDEDGDYIEYIVMSDTFAVIVEYSIEDSILSITPAPDWNGLAEISILATDGIDTAYASFSLTVIPVNDLPVSNDLLQPENDAVIMVQADSLTQSIDFIWSESADSDGDSLTYIFIPGGDWESLTPVSTGETSLSLTVADFIHLLGEEDLYCTWNILITDGQDTLTSQNGPFNVVISRIPSGFGNLARIPKTYELIQNYPNPFNPITNISFGLPENVYVEIDVFNALGQKINTLAKRDMEAGYHTIVWNGRDYIGNEISTGVYFCRLTAHNYKHVIKMVYLK